MGFKGNPPMRKTSNLLHCNLLNHLNLRSIVVIIVEVNRDKSVARLTSIVYQMNQSTSIHKGTRSVMQPFKVDNIIAVAFWDLVKELADKGPSILTLGPFHHKQINKLKSTMLKQRQKA